MCIKKYVYFLSINLHNQRASTNSACVIFSKGHSHVAINVEDIISQNQWEGFAFS